MMKLLFCLLAFTSAHADPSPREVTRAHAREIVTALTRYYHACGGYPNTEQGLDALLEKPDRAPCAHWGPKPYLPSPLSKDGWGHYWNYSGGGEVFEITSFGADGKEGGSGENEDLVFRASATQ
jgi:general secretion pathway protein G